MKLQNYTGEKVYRIGTTETLLAELESHHHSKQNVNSNLPFQLQ